MADIRQLGAQYFTYEFEEKGLLVALEKAELNTIKKFWKKYKGKSTIPDDAVMGFPFVYDDEQESLKIDFTEQRSYPIKGLKKFD